MRARTRLTSHCPLRVLAFALLLVSCSPSRSYLPAESLGRLNPWITESSGIVASRRNPGLLWTHNDAGGGPLLYCLDLRARPCGVWSALGAKARDWEDIAAGPGPKPGVSYLYIGGIGDKEATRRHITVYRVPEPEVASGNASSSPAQPLATSPAEALRLEYPDGPHDAEALLVHPESGDIYVVTKDSGGAAVYKASAPLDPRATTQLRLTARLSLPSADPRITGGDIAPDGRRVILCTYLEGFELSLGAGDGNFDQIWATTPIKVQLPHRPHGEAVAYRLDGNALLTTSEGTGTSLDQVRLR